MTNSDRRPRGLTQGSVNPSQKCIFETDGWPGHRRAEATPSFGRLCPAMTEVNRRSASAMLRPMPKCAFETSLHYFGRIVEEALAEDLVAAPFLQAHLVEPAHLAGFVGQFEN